MWPSMIDPINLKLNPVSASNPCNSLFMLPKSQATMAEEENHKLHFILIPLMAQGHMIPMIDLARLIAQRDIVVTIITTAFNAARFKATLDRAMESGLQIRLHLIRFPWCEVGLPEGCENLDSLPFSTDMIKKFFAAIVLLQQPVEIFIQELYPFPSCIVSDSGISWTGETARKFHIPRLVFHGTSCFFRLCSNNIFQYIAHGRSIKSESNPFVIPGLPHRIEATKAQLPRSMASTSAMQDVHNKIREAELADYGVVLNSFHELEPEYVDLYKKATGKEVWAVGPVSICNKETLDKVDRGNTASINESLCISWLDSKKPMSVIYACFGSICRLAPSQLMEIGLGLEASNCPFIWVIRSSEQLADFEEWLLEEFEERIKDRGLIIRGWAPQILILSHPSTGGFLTHCGWNSTLESICAGVPMITWPLFGEQFFNEKMIVHVLGIGISIGVKVADRWGEEHKDKELVKMEQVKVVTERLMDGGEEGEKMRKRAVEFGEKAKRAMEEGGSSYVNMTLLIQDIMDLVTNFLPSTSC